MGERAPSSGGISRRENWRKEEDDDGAGDPKDATERWRLLGVKGDAASGSLAGKEEKIRLMRNESSCVLD